MNTSKLAIHLTVISNHHGLLTKQYALDQNEGLTKSTHAFLSEGSASKVSISSLSEFSHLLLQLDPHQCLTYGVTEHDSVGIVRKRELHNHPGKIARDRKHFQYRQGPAILMIDYDPADGQVPLSREELWNCLYKACPAIAEASLLWAASASSNIIDSRTGVDLTGLRGQRLYMLVADGTDIPRAGKALYERLWLSGFGRFVVSSAGRLLDRTIVDSSVWQPEREDFAAGAQCIPPLVQRRPEHGCINDPARPFDSRRICDLTAEEQETVTRARRDARAVVEARKSLFAALREGAGCIIWDNVNHPIDGAAINNFLTAPVFKDRILGVSENEALPNSAMFLATGNNVRVAGDAARRFVVCRIDARVEQPYLREFNFDPLQWVVAHRTDLVAAALTLIRGYITAGSPRMVPGNTASFEVWDRLVRQTVCWVGWDDPMKTVEKNAATDPHKGLLLSILEAWFGYLGASELTSAEAFSKTRLFGSGSDHSAHAAFASAIGALASGKHDELTAHRLGLYLAKHEDEVIGGHVLRGRQDSHRKVKVWRVERAA